MYPAEVPETEMPPSYTEAVAPRPYGMAPNNNYHPYQNTAPTKPDDSQQPTRVVTVEASCPIVGPKSTRLICPHCRADVFTRTTESATAKAWMCSFLMFLTGLFCCSCIPLCMESFQKVDHHCPSCGAYVGSYQGD